MVHGCGAPDLECDHCDDHQQGQSRQKIQEMATHHYSSRFGSGRMESRSQSLMEVSPPPPPEARVLPSGEKARDSIRPGWPWRVVMSWPVTGLQRRMILSLQPE